MSDRNFTVQKWDEPGLPEAKALKECLENEGYDVFEWSDRPQTVYGPHSHSEDQSHWIISGALELTVLGETYTLQAGDRDYLPANTIHSAFVPGSQPVRYLIGAKRG
jgi:quercetin dioxygenase-like cupin family protein